MNIYTFEDHDGNRVTRTGNELPFIGWEYRLLWIDKIKTN